MPKKQYSHTIHLDTTHEVIAMQRARNHNSFNAYIAHCIFRERQSADLTPHADTQLADAVRKVFALIFDGSLRVGLLAMLLV